MTLQRDTTHDKPITHPCTSRFGAHGRERSATRYRNALDTAKRAQ